MIANLKDTLRALASSKKAVMAASTGLVFVILRLAGHYHVAIDPETAKEIAGQLILLGMAAIGAQAVADHGKEAAAISATKSGDAQAGTIVQVGQAVAPAPGDTAGTQALDVARWFYTRGGGLPPGIPDAVKKELEDALKIEGATKKEGAP